MIKRRVFISSAAAILAAPLAARAQQATSRWRVGVLLVLLSPTGKEAQEFRQGLRNAGYVEGRDLVIEWRSAEGDYTRLPQLAAELVDHRVDVIVADTTQAVQAARRATSTIPIVMAIVADPVGSGVVGNLLQCLVDIVIEAVEFGRAAVEDFVVRWHRRHYASGQRRVETLMKF